MNTSEFAESYRIQTYAEYIRAKHRDKHPGRRCQDDGWSDMPYCTATSMTTAAYSYTHNRCVCVCVHSLYLRFSLFCVCLHSGETPSISLSMYICFVCLATLVFFVFVKCAAFVCFCFFFGLSWVCLFSSWASIFDLAALCVCRSLTGKRSISPIQEEQGSEGDEANSSSFGSTSGWTNYSNVDKGFKKIKMDGMEVFFCLFLNYCLMSGRNHWLPIKRSPKVIPSNHDLNNAMSRLNVK